jgi:hypothetical protein
MRKRRGISIELEDGAEKMRFELRAGDAKPYEVSENRPRAVRVRVPLPKPETLLKMSNLWATEDRRRTAKGHLWFYIECREREIAGELLEIRKSAKRIERQLQAIRIAETVMPKLK